MDFSNRIINLKESPIRKLAPLASIAVQNGKNVYYLNIGQPDIKTPAEFFKVINSFDNDILKYAPSQGIKSLIQSIQSFYKQYEVNLRESDIIITSGGSEAILFAISVICNPFDEILIPEPFYVNTVNFVNQLSVKIIPIPTGEKNGYHLPSKEVIVNLITNKTKAILITHPNNPTGTVYTDHELQLIKELAIEYNLYIIADEVYRTITFNNIKAISFGQLTNIDEHLILIDSVSKRYSSCGARIGALISKNVTFMRYAMKLAQARLSVATIDQIGATALYSLNPDYYDRIAKIYELRRNVVIDKLQKIPGISYSNPEGAFYILIGLPIENAEDFAKWLLSDFDYNGETVFVAPAKDFYLNPLLGNNQIRLAYVYEEVALRKAIRILGLGLHQYLRENSY